MKRKTVDFIIRYEHKVRELETIMLIRAELERRGFTVAFEANYEYKQVELYDPKVLVIPSLYSDENIAGDIAKYGLKKKIANLLWEQLIGQLDEDSPNCSHNVRGIGQKAITFCWGQQTKDRIVRGGVPEANAKVVGQLNTDLLRPPFSKSLLSKEELAQRYNLDVNKKWVFFISSFAYCELDELQKSLIYKEFGQEKLDYMVNLSNKSRDIILKWFEKVLNQNPDDIIIYRPHPDEARKSQVLKDLEKKYSNFRVISELALKHWINVSDKIYNWYSTGLIDVVVLNKPYRIIRPVKISKEEDYKIYYNAKHITTEEEFLIDYHNYDCKEILDKDLFNSYYYMPKGYVYEEVCNILQDMVETDKYDIKYSLREYLKFGCMRIRFLIKQPFKNYIPLLSRLPIFKRKFKKREFSLRIKQEGYEKNVATESDITELYSRIKPYLNGQKV